MKSVFDDPVEKQLEPEVQRLMMAAITRLKKTRISKGWSQQRLAKASGLQQAWLNRLEKGKDFQFTSYIKLCLTLKVQPFVKMLPWRDPSLPPETVFERVGERLRLQDIDEKLKAKGIDIENL